jgi:hypothetical protein
MRLMILILSAASLVLAQDKPAPQPDVATLKIQLATAQAQAQFWQARAEFYKSQWLTVAGQLTDEHAQPQLLQRVSCGAEYDVKQDQGVPTCVVKPTPTPPPPVTGQGILRNPLGYTDENTNTSSTLSPGR